jgi:beta-glucosidase
MPAPSDLCTRPKRRDVSHAFSNTSARAPSRTAISRTAASPIAASLLTIALLGSATPAAAAEPLYAAVPPESTANPELWPQVHWPETLTPAQEARVQSLLSQMSLACKAGQVIQADILKVTPEDVSNYHLGSVLNGGTSGPHGDDFAPAAAWLKLADAYYEGSMKPTEGCPVIPVMWGIDAVHGQNNIIGATLFPHNVGLGATRDPALMERIGAAAAREIRVTGQDWTFAPTIAVPQDWRWGRSYEGFSSDPALVSTLGAAMIRGLQGPVSSTPILARGRVAASAKHFIGDGGTLDGRDQGDARVSEDYLRWAYGPPYAAAIEAGVASVMTSYSSWNGLKMHGNKSLLTDVLRKRMGFDGMIVTDWNGHGQIKGCTPSNCPQSLNAGNDMYMIPDGWKQLYANIQAQAQDGTIPMARLDDAVRQVLRMKMRMGLFEAGKPSARQYGGQFEVLGAPEHRAVAREAVRKSLVLLKNDGVLPLKSSARILVAGDAADDIGRQSGGWTISWQGTGVTNDHFPGATSIWKGIADAVQAGGGQAELNAAGDYKQKPDAAIVVFGETAYAEGLGDIPSLQLRTELKGPLATMKKLRAQGIPVVAVMISGRPLFVNPELNAVNGFVEAWLPGSEGGGVADVLFARNGADFTGKLPVAWPVSAKRGAPALFAFGYGLTMKDGARPWTTLSEDAGEPSLEAAGLLLEKGAALAGYRLRDDGAAGRVTISDARDAAQPGARHIAMKAGDTPVTLELTADQPLDIHREALAPVMVVMTVKFDSVPTAPWTATIKCGANCQKTIPLPSIARVQPGKWTTVGWPLRCFSMSQQDMSKVSAPFSVATSGAANFSLAKIQLSTVAEVRTPCPN